MKKGKGLDGLPDPVLIATEQVSIPAGSTIGFGYGTLPDGRKVRFLGDHRPMRDLGEAIRAAQEPIEAEVAHFFIQAVGPDADRGRPA